MNAIDVVKVDYIKKLLANGVREDSRGLMDFRPVKIVPNAVEHAEGSAQVDLGATRVLCGAKLVVGTPMEDTPNQGGLVFSAELLPLASAEYETGPPSPNAIELARVVDRGIRSGNVVNLEKLFIEEGKAWTVYVDLYVLNYDGNLFDASSMAAMSALLNAHMPKYEDGKAIMSESAGKLAVDNTVISSTFGKIGDKIVLDTTGLEESAADARLTVAVDNDNVRAMQKGLNGSFTVSEIDELVGTAFNKYKELKGYVDRSADR